METGEILVQGTYSVRWVTNISRTLIHLVSQPTPVGWFPPRYRDIMTVSCDATSRGVTTAVAGRRLSAGLIGVKPRDVVGFDPRIVDRGFIQADHPRNPGHLPELVAVIPPGGVPGHEVGGVRCHEGSELRGLGNLSSRFPLTTRNVSEIRRLTPRRFSVVKSRVSEPEGG